MVKQPPTVEPARRVLLVVTESQNLARRIESDLRNAGHAVRVAWVPDLEDLKDALERAKPDLLICAQGLASAPHRDVIVMCENIAPDVPVVLLVDKLSPDKILAALEAGAHDAVCAEERDGLKHLVQVFLREAASHDHVRDLRRTRMQLADFETRHRSLIAGTADAVANVQEGIVSHTNPAFATLLGYADPTELAGLPVMDLVCTDQQGTVKEHFQKLLKGKIGDGAMDFCFQHKDGHAVKVTALVSRSVQEGEFVVELLVRSEKQPGTAAAHADSPGRMALFETMDAARSGKAGDAPAGLMLVLVDDFRALEDRLGYRDAEQVVNTLGELIHARLPHGDTLYRFSTSELAALVSRKQGLDLEALAAALRKEISAQVFKTAAFEAHLTATVVAYPLGGTDTGTNNIVNETGHEARRLSAAGGNRISVLGPTGKAAQQEKEEQRLASRVKKALEDGRLKLAYQSIASLEGDSGQLYDVFVRMVDETGNELLARDFLPAAAKYGLMRAVDRWVLGRSLKVLAKRADSRDGATLFVRLSEDTLKDADNFIKWLKEKLEERALRPDELILELQEHIVQSHIRKAKALAAALHELGADIAIDYFGISNNSAPLLGHLPCRFVKFHPSFTQEFNKAGKVARMQELLEVAKQQSVKVIVSHVEDANVMARLWQMGVNYIQGNSVQEPEVVLLSADVNLR